MGPEDGFQQLGIVLQATAFGFACAASRHLTSTVWMAVGIHTGFHLWRDVVVDVHPADHAVTLATVAAYTLLGVLLLGTSHRRAGGDQGR